MHSRGVQPIASKCRGGVLYFNPCTHEECNPHERLGIEHLTHISIHALTRSATRSTVKGSVLQTKFQSMHSRGVQQSIATKVLIDTDGISIHALTRSATHSKDLAGRIIDISIHALTRSATPIAFPVSPSIPISIHALTRSATFFLSFCFLLERFQSMHSRGVQHQRPGSQIHL